MSVAVVQNYPANVIVPSATSGLRDRGVPPGGAYDTCAAALVMAATGSSTVLELLAPVRLVTSVSTLLAIAGPPCRFLLAGTARSGPAVLAWEAGADLEILAGFTGRVTLGWPGLKTPHTLPSLIPSELPSMPAAAPDRLIRLAAEEGGPHVLRVIDATEELAGIGLTVLPGSDRVGVRLKADLAPRSGLARSEPCVQGAIQSTPDGTLLVHGPDGPTIGGYEKVGFVVRADWSKLAHVLPGQTVSLRPVSRGEAMEAWHAATVQSRLACASLADRLGGPTAAR